ncbi:MAG TPA: sulfatase [Bacillales bacterium]
MNVVVILMDTLRRDHLGCYGTEKASVYLENPIQTPNLDRFAERGTVFEQAFLGSFPCMPARRDFWTGRYEFPWRGWGPLEDYDVDFINLLRSYGWINMLISDHYHVLERDAGNYHFGFNGWDMVRGQEHDPYVTDPLQDGTKERLDHGRSGAWYLHQKNKRGERKAEEDLYAPQVFRRVSSWLERNAAPDIRRNKPFFLMVECFDPHEPWDPPLHYVEPFDPGYRGKRPHSPVYGTANRFSDAELRQMRALYAGELTMVDHWFGRFLEKADQLDLWQDTLIVVTTDHGFFLGEHDLIGKPELVPLYSEMSHIPLMMYHPEGRSGQRSGDLVQLVDLFPTVMESLGLSLPERTTGKMIPGQGNRKAWEGIQADRLHLHGKSLLPLIRGGKSPTREIAVTGKFGDVIRICDGQWSLYLTPKGDQPLYWYGSREPGRTFAGRRGKFDPREVRYPIQYPSAKYENALYDLVTDSDESRNVIYEQIIQRERLEKLFAGWLKGIEAPGEVADRYGVNTT